MRVRDSVIAERSFLEYLRGCDSCEQRRDLGREWFEMRSPDNLCDIVLAMANFVKDTNSLDDMIPRPNIFIHSLPNTSEILELKKKVLYGDQLDEDALRDIADAYKHSIIKYRDTYLEAWCLGDVDKAFVTKHGHTLSGPQKTMLLLRVLAPSWSARVRTGELEMSDKVDELRVRCVHEVLAALGLRHALDVETSCGDYWSEPFEESRLFKTASVFRDFSRAMPLFRDDPQPPKKGWTRQNATHVVDTVLASIGLKIKGSVVNKRDGDTRTRMYTYKLDEAYVADMREFLALKLRTISSATGFGAPPKLEPPSLDVSIREQPIEIHAHLLARRPKPPTPCPSDAEDVDAKDLC